MALVETEFAHGVMTITLNDEPRRNALSHQLLEELMAAIDEVERASEVRVAVLTNRGRVFSAGADLRASSGAVATGDRRTVELSDVLLGIRRSPKPFVGRIAGHCIAGGVGLASATDISIALDSSTFGFSEVRVGVAPAMISVVCLPKMRLADAQSAFLRGNRFGAAEAARMGLINDAVAPEDLDRAVGAVIDDLLTGEPGALAAAKQLTMIVPSLSIDEAFAWTTDLSRRLFATDEAREGMAAFLEKRPASWVRQLPREG